MVGRLPDFLIIGAMKCGTSSLHDQLSRRSGLFMSTPKEPNFFSDDEQFERGLEWYSSLFGDAGEHQLCGESSTHYTKLPTYPHTVARLRNHLPSAKMIYVMREPISRLVSQYIHEWTQREVTGSLEEAIKENERFVAYSCYARQLEPFLEAWGPSAVLPVAFERMVEYPDQEFERVCRFIGDPTPGERRWDRDVAPDNVSRDRLRRSAFRDGLLEIPGAQGIKNRLPQVLRDRIKDLWRMRKRPTIPQALRREVEARIDEDLQRLGAWLGIELSCQDWRQRALEQPFGWVDADGAS